MIVSYAPADGEARRWTFRPGEIESLEAEAIEEATGWTFYEFSDQLIRGFTRAKRAALWILLRREQPDLHLDDLNFRQVELFVGYEPEEIAGLRASLESATTQLPPEERAAWLAAIAQTTEITRDPAEADALPELRGPVPVGKDTAGGDANGSGT